MSHLFPDMQLIITNAWQEKIQDRISQYLQSTLLSAPQILARRRAETDILKKTFKPLEALAKELGAYLVPALILNLNPEALLRIGKARSGQTMYILRI